MNSNLTDRIKAMIADHFGIDPNKLKPETETASLGIDSLAMIEFMFQMEEKFDVHLADSRTPLLTVADVVAEIEHAVGAQASPQGA
jgi:acyl carrier protein